MRVKVENPEATLFKCLAWIFVLTVGDPDLIDVAIKYIGSLGGR
jgi:hypothetical protein